MVALQRGSLREQQLRFGPGTAGPSSDLLASGGGGVLVERSARVTRGGAAQERAGERSAGCLGGRALRALTGHRSHSRHLHAESGPIRAPGGTGRLRGEHEPLERLLSSRFSAHSSLVLQFLCPFIAISENTLLLRENRVEAYNLAFHYLPASPIHTPVFIHACVFPSHIVHLGLDFRCFLKTSLSESLNELLNSQLSCFVTLLRSGEILCHIDRFISKFILCIICFSFCSKILLFYNNSIIIMIIYSPVSIYPFCIQIRDIVFMRCTPL